MFIFFSLFRWILIPAIIVAVGAAAAVTVLSVLKKKRKREGKLSKKQTLIQGICDNIASFTDMFEPVYLISEGRHKKQTEVFAAWNEKVQACEEDNGFKALFEKQFGDFETWDKRKKNTETEKTEKENTETEKVDEENTETEQVDEENTETEKTGKKEKKKAKKANKKEKKKAKKANKKEKKKAKKANKKTKKANKKDNKKAKKANKIYKKKSKKLLKIFKKAKIVRSKDVYETGGESTAERYIYAGGESIKTDECYDVLAPYWSYNDSIVDKGVIR